ncbi:2-phosphosulfolactate phosphatase, partial [Candidatus Woesearchaeota archaeon]|nr:2-phosphosulfolactate phosphatase [Candidatus Woesearchaeota archaeon]
TDFSGKTAVMSTSAGTCGIICAKKADEIVLGSFVCAKAVADYILKKRPDTVTLVALGNAGLKKTDEDELCAAYIKELLQGKSPDEEYYLDRLRHSPDAQRFFDPAKKHSPEGDFYCASDLNRFDFVMKVQRQGKYMEIIKE